MLLLAVLRLVVTVLVTVDNGAAAAVVKEANRCLGTVEKARLDVAKTSGRTMRMMIAVVLIAVGCERVVK